jgi:hypothetical protein
LGYANSVKWAESPGNEKYRRGMYIFFQRTVPYPMLMTFDAPDSNTTCTRRERSNTPLQALTLLNDPVFFDCARALGKRVAEAEGLTVRQRLDLVYRICLSREPSLAELARLETLYAAALVLAEKDGDGAKELVGAGKEGAPSPEAAAWVLIARTVLNLDEFVTRE